jgi:hypothetical protein
MLGILHERHPRLILDVESIGDEVDDPDGQGVDAAGGDVGHGVMREDRVLLLGRLESDSQAAQMDKEGGALLLQEGIGLGAPGGW